MKNQLRLPLAAQGVIEFYETLETYCDEGEPTMASLIGQDEQDVVKLVETLCEADARIFGEETQDK